jgi:lipoprotein-anchoring transpeptidase ErfK/SrfK
MRVSSLERKTVRPGRLASYSYYSDRHPVSAAGARPKAADSRGSWRKWGLLAAVIVIGLIAIPMWQSRADSDGKNKAAQTTAGGSGQDKQKAAAAAPATADKKQPAAVNPCADNTESKHIIVGVEARHLWACEGSQSVYDTPVITGLRNDPETETPLGTYKIYAKQTNTTLTGSDSRGTWRDPVYYWMPFLTNQYGTYGFHDATWRDDNAFGNISPDSDDASHGCVELPLGASKWLYNWAPVGTYLTVEA